MINIITGLTAKIPCENYNKEKSKEPYRSQIKTGKEEFNSCSEKEIQERKSFWCSSIPFKGTLNYFKENKVKEKHKVNAEGICEDTAVITLSNKHAGALMGGHDKSADKKHRSDHVLFFGGVPDTQKPFKKILEKKLELSLTAGLMYGSSFALSALIPANVAGLAAWGISVKVLEKLGFENPILSIFELNNLEGMSANALKAGTYEPIPLVGLDTSAMRKKASEIKEKAEYNTITKNCSWAVLECIKAGLPDEVNRILPSTGLYVTPTDVENIVNFLVDGGHVLLGEMDKDGVAWFDAQDTLS